MDIIDTRDLNERLEELSELKDGIEYLYGVIDDLENNLDEDDVSYTDNLEDLEDATYELNDLLAEFDTEEYEALCKMRDEIPEWEHGNTLIHSDYFTEYAIDMLKDCGDLPQDIPWYIVIDEEATAENLKCDYGVITYDDEDYYYRSY